MPDPAAYPGSPSLSAEAREKVLQTFRHTLEMARSGRNEDALLGCDFILKMDARFTPARRLLASLRGIASGTVIDLAEFDAFDFGPAPARAAPAPIPTPASTPAASPVPRAAAPATPAAGYAVPTAPGAAPDSFASSLDGIGFDDLGANPFAAAPATAPAPLAAPSFAPPQDPGFGAPEPPPSFAASDAFSSAPSFGTAGPDPFASALPPDAGYPPPADPFAPAGGVVPFPPAAPPAGAGPAVDQRIVQFLKQGDDSAARGHLQEAIDLWSRVFLIDLSNEEASRRIDAARDKQSEAARQLDVYLSEGVQLYEAGDLSSARNAFLKVLTLSESDATARNYLNQIDAALAIPGAGAPATVSSSAAGLDEPYLRDELEAPVRPSFAEGLPSLEEHARSESSLEEMPLEGGRVQAEAPGRRGKVDVRLILGVGALVLVGVAAAAFFLFKPKSTGPSPEAAAPPAAGAPAQDPLQKAKALFQQGKVDEALEILTAIPSGDPRHEQAYVLIEQFKSSAEPQPSASPAASEALVDEARLAGLASLSSGRYIDAVKSLDLVVKARPDDGEAAQALSRARDAVAALGSAIRSYNEQDYESAQRLLWEIRKADPKNQDVEEYLFKSYFNDGILSLQSGSTKKAADAFKEAAALRPQDIETQRHLKFARRYANGTDDLLARIYVKHVSPRP